MRYADNITRLESEGAFEVLAKARRMEQEGRKIIHMQIGEPDFDTPRNITEAAYQAILRGQTHYAPSGGIPEGREVVAQYMSRTRGVTWGAENSIIMPGCKPLIYCSMMALINPGDEIIVPNPGYPTYRSVTKYLGATPISVKLREENDFRFLVSDFEKLITPKTRMIILNSPENPTGGQLTWEDLEAIYALAKKHDLWILSDEIYSRIVYDTQFKSIAAIPGALDRTVAIDGLSKTYAMTGWRLGFACMPKRLADYLFTIAINAFSSTATFTQYAMIEALTGPQTEIDQMVAEFRRRRDVIVDGLNSMEGVHCKKPEGAFYVFPNITGTGLNSKQFADMSLEQAGVACLAGSAFGEHGEGYARFSYANSIDNIRAALKQIKEVLATAKR